MWAREPCRAGRQWGRWGASQRQHPVHGWAPGSARPLAVLTVQACGSEVASPLVWGTLPRHSRMLPTAAGLPPRQGPHPRAWQTSLRVVIPQEGPSRGCDVDRKSPASQLVCPPRPSGHPPAFGDQDPAASQAPGVGVANLQLGCRIWRSREGDSAACRGAPASGPSTGQGGGVG